MTQKFFRGHRVKIADELPWSMSHFPGAGKEAIVDHSASDRHLGARGRRLEEYGLLVKTDTGWTYSAWYDEEHLTLVDSDRDAGEQILQDYKGRKR